MTRGYYGWLAGASLSAFGDTALFFALGWAASGIGPHAAGLVLTAYTLPRAVLLILGGVLGDRHGPRQVLLASHCLLAVLTFALAYATHLTGTTVALLLATAAIIGTVDAFALPAAGSFPRLFAGDDELPRAMALKTSTQQLVTLVAGPAGGALVAFAGLVGALVVDGFTFAVAFAVLLAIRPPNQPPEPQAQRSVLAEAMDGLRLAWSDRVLRALLLTVALAGASVLPVTSLCVPLLARAHHWAPSQAGVIVGATVAGGLAVALLVARVGTYVSLGAGAAAGCLVAAAGLCGLAVAPSVPLAVGSAVVQGVGVGLFGAHLSPLFVASTPRSHLSRLQSVLVLMQTLPLIVSNNLLGAVAGVSPRLAVLLCAAGLAGAGACSATLRTARTAVI
ncbi:MFS transporter [Kribbella voronezhensis]|uniref:MFS transporter n=1 Tax=Kribbella voronezhensis TaxID=2512212 RepID=A0A4R7TFG7_9ACTN|nr:MFS transporter [Kribbella voronezhensis]TDU90157.1 MFS transporter [Kribbella voronezhensis]